MGGTGFRFDILYGRVAAALDLKDLVGHAQARRLATSSVQSTSRARIVGYVFLCSPTDSLYPK